MDLDKLLKLSADLGRPRSAFGQLHETALRASGTSSAFKFQEEALKAPTARLFDSTIELRLSRQIDDLEQSFAQRVLREPVFGIAKESPFLAAQARMEQSLQCKLTEIATGLSARSASAQIAEDFLSQIKGNILPKFHSYLESETESLRRALRVAAEHPSASALASLTATINATSFITAANWMRGFDVDTGIMKQIFEPSVAYGHFAARTLEQLSNPISDFRRAALSGSLLLAEEQAIRTSTLLTPLADYSVGGTEAISPPLVLRRPVINRYRLQREELLSREEEIPDDADYETLSPLAPSVELYDIARKCMELVGLCDETNETCTGETVFKLTSMLLISFSSLLGTVAQNRMTLAQVVESLYIVLYESAGKDKLRYLERNYLTREECELIWKIKHLRNKWLSHDADHGSERDIRESRRLRLEALNWLGVERIPTQREEYARIQRLLLERVEEFLALLLRRIAGADDSIN